MGLILGKIRQFGADERGIAMILVAILLPVLVGFALLAIDVGRGYSLNNDLQRGTDALALAGAAELDGRSDSIVRAKLAITNLVKNTYRFSDEVTPSKQILEGADVTLRFLKEIPADDATPIGPTYAGLITDEVAGAVDARFVEVTAPSTGFDSTFPVALLGFGHFDMQTVSVAGFNRAICESVPIFMCNPFKDKSGTGKSIQQAFADGDTYSREFRILKVDSNPGPGNFGLLDNDLTSLRDAFAIGTSGVCYRREAVETKTGVTLGQVNSGLNVRFDIYSKSLSKENNNPLYRPATNVRKGANNKSNCNKFSAATDGKAMGFPEGNNYDSATGMTDSTWSRDLYWSVNHGGPGVTTMPTKIKSNSHPTSKDMLPSRYDVYKYEIDPDGDPVTKDSIVGDQSLAPHKETGIPACYKGDAAKLTNDPDRRLIAMAVVDCTTANMPKINGHTELRPDGYVTVFLTNPIEKQDNSKDDEDDTANEKPIRFEIVDAEGPLGNGSLDKLLRDEAQLYR